jgi:protein-disulfide isomerase-like protein with CxxC motif
MLKCMDIVDHIVGPRDVTAAAVLADLASAAGMAADTAAALAAG